jgi:LPPG:FO 2-phospho-L-lactate transferase
MTDERVMTWVETVEQGWLPFQEYFVREGCRPIVKGFRFSGAEAARPTKSVLEALQAADWVVICPSNPWVSIGPLLALPEVAALVREKPLVAVSPIIGGQALKGPAAKMYRELGINPSALAVAQHYLEQLHFRNKNSLPFVFCIDTIDAGLAGTIREQGVDVLVTQTIMQTTANRRQLAEEILHAISTLERRQRGV